MKAIFEFLFLKKPALHTLRITIALIAVGAYFSIAFDDKARNSSQKQDSEQINQADEKRLDSLIGAMTVEEKVAMLCGNGLFSSTCIERLGIPELHYTDGPFGVREEINRKSWNPAGWTNDSATFFPTGSALAASWNTDLAYKFGTGIGQEAKTRGKDVLLAPAVNITRTPLNGRTFEYMSEDPFLNSKLAVNYIRGVQDCGVSACVKHFAANNQETNRGSVNVIMDERTLREIYLPAFKSAVVEGHVSSVMAAYNKFRGSYCSENEYLLNTILRKEWKFKGFVVSDWGGTHSTVRAAMNGLDVEMGTSQYFAKTLLDSVKYGTIPESVINEKVRRILRVKLFTLKNPIPPANSLVSTPAHEQIAYDIAAQTIVLLKNSRNLLPLNGNEIHKLVVIGDNATHRHALGGFGAGVKTRIEVTPLAGLKDRIGKKTSIEFVQGYKPKFTFKKKGFGRDPVNVADTALIRDAVNAAKNADAVILFVGNNHDVETEATDRTSLLLPFGQDELIKAVCAANHNTIIVVVAGAPVDLHEADASGNAILWSWFNGSEGGHAIADVILGTINPSGKLPFTIPSSLDHSPAHALAAFPGDSSEVYKEGILVGYRWFDTKKILPMFCFGYGLSYTDFSYSDLKTNKNTYGADEKISVSMKLKNTGMRDGMETVQIYASDLNPKILKASKELKAFKKVLVQAGKEIEITMEIAASDLSYFDESLNRWNLSPGKYSILAGSSSRDIRATCDMTIK
jgi:beta-glucosidase